MHQELDSLKAEVDRLLAESGLAVFHCDPRFEDSLPSAILWDALHYPEPASFIKSAKAIDVKLICYHHRDVSSDFIDRLVSDLDETDFPREIKREYERELRKLKAYEGFTSYVELSYDFAGETYFFISSATWYRRLLEIMSEIDGAFEEDEDDEPSPPMSGFFSKN